MSATPPELPDNPNQFRASLPPLPTDEQLFHLIEDNPPPMPKSRMVQEYIEWGIREAERHANPKPESPMRGLFDMLGFPTEEGL